MTLRRWMLVLVIAPMVVGGQARAADRCAGQRFTPLEWPCSHTMIARRRSQSFVAVKHMRSSVADVFVYRRTRREFLTSYPGCRAYGRYANVRVQVITCDGKLVVRVRSVAGPTPVVFRWQELRHASTVEP